MARHLALACVVLPVALTLAACGGAATPKPAHTHPTDAQACEALGKAVNQFYAIASPGSTVRRVDFKDLPNPNGVEIPKPDCSFEMRPDPDLVPGDVWTLENFYLTPLPVSDRVISQRLVKAGYVLTPDTTNYSLHSNRITYSASILMFNGTDDQQYSKAAEQPLLDFTIGQR